MDIYIYIFSTSTSRIRHWKVAQNTVVFRQVIFCENETHDARATGGALSPYKARVAGAFYGLPFVWLKI